MKQGIRSEARHGSPSEHGVRRRRTVIGLAALAGLLASAAMPRVGLRVVRASPMFPFIPNHYTFSHDQVFGAIARKFPYHRAMAQVFDLALTNPGVAFEPEANRVAVSADVALTSPFLNAPVHGSLTLNTQLVYDPQTLSIQLERPAVERTEFGPSADAYKPQIDAALTAATQQLLDHYPIYTFKPEQLTFAGAQFEPGAITVLKDGIKVEIVQRTP
ncbi:DUF1439 domain-containing protein [Pararobbsia silviterrae]|uniref:DUF1439 domain-containing protein n=1 Tax=Pararobbsia silviterrae TaxID=1792498 RepID=A0A494Y8U8_9BURK|nr:DUF1439 domain-containing protein [Pararobbsia silviterrae]RKP59111.1 DUF1439 domain-containing protein [Pararobbsia silviterrae]